MLDRPLSPSVPVPVGAGSRVPVDVAELVIVGITVVSVVILLVFELVVVPLVFELVVALVFVALVVVLLEVALPIFRNCALDTVNGV